MVEAVADIISQNGVADHLGPVEQEIVVIEHVLNLFCLHIGCKQLLEFTLPVGDPRIMLAQYVLERRLGIHRARIDGKTGAFCRKAAFGLGKTQLVPGKVHQVGAVFAVVDGEIDVEPDLLGIDAQQAGADAVKGA